MNVPKLRFKEFNEELNTFKIKDTGNVITGMTPSTADKENYGTEYLWVSPGDMGYSKYIANTKTKLSLKGFNKTRQLPDNSILVTCIGSTIGKMGMSNSTLSTNQQINSIIPTKIFNPNYLYYCINYNFPKFLNKISFQAVPIISKSEFEKLEIKCTPNLSEQEKIGNMLDLLDKKIELQSKKIEDLKLFKKGLLIKEFNNKKCSNKLKECFDFGKAGGTPKSTNKDYYNGYIPFLSISDMTTQGKYIYYTDKSITEAGLNNSTAWLVPKNSIIISMYASYGLVSINKIDLTTSQAMFNMVINKNYVVEYIYYYLYYLYISNFYNSIVSTGTQSNLNAEQIKLLDIYIPCYNEQKRIYEQFSKIDFKINLERKKINELLYLKKGLMQNMFV